MARPSKYTQEYIDKAYEYLANFETLDTEQAEVIPSIAGLSKYLGVNRSTLYEHAKKHKQFSDILDEIMTAQELVLFNGSLRGKLNPVISKLMLTKHGYHDKVESDINTREIPKANVTFTKPKKDKPKLKVVSKSKD